MSDDQQAPWSGSFTRTCFGCGRTITMRDGKAQRHGCRFRWFSRRLWRSYLEGWHSAHRFAVEHPDDPMCLADGEDYGSGWAGIMRGDGTLRVSM